ncbi:PAS domain S-box protein [bacterium]|nr:PAS domain S-box protein [bacterium]
MSENTTNNIILLIDPDPGTRPLLNYALSGTGLQIKQFASGQEGLAIIPELQPKLIICEFMTADWTGKTIFEHFMTDSLFVQYRQIPFIFFSHQTYKRMFKASFLNKGLWGWFTKPFGAHELREVIENIFQGLETAQKNQELRQEVKRSEYRYRDLLETANDFIFTLDDNGCFAYLNNRFAPLTNLDKEAWIGRNFLDLISDTDRSLALERYEMAHHGKARIFEAHVMTHNIQSPILSFNITPIVERGAIVGSIGIARDVTDRKRMEKEILDLKNFNESIIESMEAGLMTIDPDGRLTSINRGGEVILGLKSQDVLGSTLNELLDINVAKILLQQQDNSSLKLSREVELFNTNGDIINIGFTSTDRMDNQDRKVGTIISFRDISQLKQMQSEVIRMDRLVSLGVLASGIAHEIKNPLAGIKALAQACDEEFEGDDPRREYLSRIVRQVNRLDDLLKTFFAYARPTPPDRKRHNLKEILLEVTNLVGKKMIHSGVEFSETEHLPVEEAYVDSQQLQQVFLNLILNAIDAMPNGGCLTFDFSTIIKEDHKLPWAQVKIKDTGHGIAANKLETIFDPFFTTKPNGLGLGLSIVYRIINEHGGDIRVFSQKSEGTTFILRLPTGAGK